MKQVRKVEVLRDDIVNPNVREALTFAAQAVTAILDQRFTGTIGEALHIGNRAIFALQILDGSYEVTAANFEVATPEAVIHQ